MDSYRSEREVLQVQPVTTAFPAVGEPIAIDLHGVQVSGRLLVEMQIHFRPTIPVLPENIPALLNYDDQLAQQAHQMAQQLQERFTQALSHPQPPAQAAPRESPGIHLQNLVITGSGANRETQVDS